MDAPTEIKPKANLSDFLAAERTFLAWIRTGLALMGFGFVVARFGLFLQQLELNEHPRLASSIWVVALVRHRPHRCGSGRISSFRMASFSTRPGVESRRASALPPVNPGRIDCFVPGFRWACDGDLPDLCARFREPASSI